MKKLLLLLSAITIINYSHCCEDLERVRRYETLSQTERNGMLLAAADSDDLQDVAELCLATGANINGDGIDRRPLHWAAQRGRVHMVRWLLAHGANPRLRDNVGKTALHAAANDEIFDLLYSACPDLIEAADAAGWTLLLNAIKRDDLMRIEKLLRLGADVNRQSSITEDDYWHVTRPIHLALHRADHDQETDENNHEILDLLLRRGADVNARDGGGETPLYKTSWLSDLKEHETEAITLVKKLVEHGADLFLASDGELPFTIAGRKVKDYLWSKMRPRIMRAIHVAQANVPMELANLITELYPRDTIEEEM